MIKNVNTYLFTLHIFYLLILIIIGTLAMTNGKYKILLPSMNIEYILRKYNTSNAIRKNNTDNNYLVPKYFIQIILVDQIYKCSFLI